jgi:hypothetical protein
MRARLADALTSRAAPTDSAPTGPDYFFPDAIVEIVHDDKKHAMPLKAA